MTSQPWVIPVFGTALVTVAVFALIRAISASVNRRLAAAHPWQKPAPGAVSRRFQSFHIGGMGLLWGFHVSVDEQHLHLFPTFFARTLGLRPTSVPWAVIRMKKRSRSGRWAEVTIGDLGVFGPAWCLGLAEPGVPRPRP